MHKDPEGDRISNINAQSFPNNFINYFPYPKGNGNKGNRDYTEKKKWK